MRSITDNKVIALRKLGYNGTVNEMMSSWLVDNGATSRQINDASHQFLADKGVTKPYNISSGWYSYLGSLGYTGGLSSRELGFWRHKADSRYFRLNEGTTDYISIPEVVHLGDFKHTFKFMTTQAVNTSLYGTELFMKIELLGSDNGRIKLLVGNGSSWVINRNTEGVGFNDGLLHTATVSKVGSLYELHVDGVQEVSLTDARPVTPKFSKLLGVQGGPPSTAEGVLADFEVFDSGVIIRNYPINDNSNTIRDLVSGQDGTVINGNADDWGLFTEQPALWKGSGLAVPPWASSDQSLLKA